MKNEIGTDPTMVDVIETLDVPVPEKKIEPKNENKQNNNDKKKEKKQYRNHHLHRISFSCF